MWKEDECKDYLSNKEKDILLIDYNEVNIKKNKTKKGRSESSTDLLNTSPFTSSSSFASPINVTRGKGGDEVRGGSKKVPSYREDSNRNSLDIGFKKNEKGKAFLNRILALTSSTSPMNMHSSTLRGVSNESFEEEEEEEREGSRSKDLIKVNKKGTRENEKDEVDPRSESSLGSELEDTFPISDSINKLLTSKEVGSGNVTSSLTSKIHHSLNRKVTDNSTLLAMRVAQIGLLFILYFYLKEFLFILSISIYIYIGSVNHVSSSGDDDMIGVSSTSPNEGFRNLPSSTKSNIEHRYNRER